MAEVLWLERRRFWSDEDKLEIVTSVGIGGATVTQMAQRHEITRQQIYVWRLDLKRKGLWSPDGGELFFPGDIPAGGYSSGSGAPGAYGLYCRYAATDRDGIAFTQWALFEF